MNAAADRVRRQRGPLETGGIRLIGRRVRLGPSLTLILPVALVSGLLALTAFLVLLPALRGDITRARERSAQDLTRSARSVLVHYQQLEQSGRMSRAEAQGRAIDVLRALRYGPELSECFWVTDLEPRMVMHPLRTDLEGQDLTEFAGPDGQHLFVEFVDRTALTGRAFLRHTWRFPDDPPRIVPMISYVERFEPWGWIVGTGAQRGDIDAEVAAISRKTAAGILAALVLTAALLAGLLRAGLRARARTRTAEQALAQANRELSESNHRLAQQRGELEEFIYLVSHDLKSPLIAIQGFTRLLAERLRAHLRAEENDYFRRILSNVGQMEARLNGLLTLARAGRLPPTEQDVPVAALLDEILGDFAVRAEARGVRLTRGSGLPNVTGCAQDIRAVFENLIDNAIKYMPLRPSAHIHVGYDPTVTAPNGMRGAYYVRDNGPGVPGEHQERIFEMFHRGPHAASSQEGSGLGLVIVKRLVAAHGGIVWVESFPGRGATFFVALPGLPLPPDLGQVAREGLEVAQNV
jgi:signal transduction histidine kinase